MTSNAPGLGEDLLQVFLVAYISLQLPNPNMQLP